MLVVIDPSGRLNAVGVVTEKDFVQVEFQDFLLAQGPLDFNRQKNLVELAGEGALLS